VALAILMELNIRLTVLVVETARLERRGVNDNDMVTLVTMCDKHSSLFIKCFYCAKTVFEYMQELTVFL
jgi:hypothetical protein